MFANRLFLLTLVVLLSAVQTLSDSPIQRRPNRGLVRFADSQHIPIQRPANVEPAKTKSATPTKTKKPLSPAQFDSKKKVPVKPVAAASPIAVSKKSSKPVDDKYRSEFEEYMRQQIQQWQIAVVNGQPVSPPAGSQPSGQPPSSVWIQVPANGYYPPPSYPYPPYPQPSYPPSSYPSPSYPPPSYPPPSYPQPSYPPPSYPSPSYPPPSYPPSTYPQPAPYPQYPQPSPYPQQPLYPPQPAPNPTSEVTELSTPAPSEGVPSQPDPSGVATPQPEESSTTSSEQGYPSPPAPEYPSSPAPEYPPVPENSSTPGTEYPPVPENSSTPGPEYPSTPSPGNPGTPPPNVVEPDIPEITQVPTDKPYQTTTKPEGSTDLPEVIPAYPDTQQPEQPGIPIYPGQPEVSTTIQPEVSTNQPTYPEKPSSENPGEEPEVTTTSDGTTYSPDPDAPVSTGAPSTDVLKAQCKEPRGQFPSESSCNKFINCWDETAVEQTCPAGLVFNSEKRYCDYPANVNCGSRPITVSPENGNSTNCPDPYGTYRSKKNCGAFYVCVAGVPVEFICPGGTNYNEDLKICDYPYRVDCKGLPTNPEPIETGTEIEPITTYAPEISSTTQTVPLSSAESSPATEVVPTTSTAPTPVVDPIAIYNYNLRKIPPSLVNTGVRCSHKSIYRLTPDCSSVTLCRNGFTHILNCGYATSYDIVSQKCMESQRANCGRSF